MLHRGSEAHRTFVESFLRWPIGRDGFRVSPELAISNRLHFTSQARRNSPVIKPKAFVNATSPACKAAGPDEPVPSG